MKFITVTIDTLNVPHTTATQNTFCMRDPVCVMSCCHAYYTGTAGKHSMSNVNWGSSQRR